jgi:diadenosine tetraphosphate (Ap4A) HIT family hydrolase
MAAAAAAAATTTATKGNVHVILGIARHPEFHVHPRSRDSAEAEDEDGSEPKGGLAKFGRRGEELQSEIDAYRRQVWRVQNG